MDCKICGNVSELMCSTAIDGIWHLYLLDEDGYKESLDLKSIYDENYTYIKVDNLFRYNKFLIQAWSGKNLVWIGQFLVNYPIIIKSDIAYYLKLIESLKYLG